jgi:predicted RNase H-like HicB family nuclease
MKFAVVVHPEPEGGYWGEVPALPGCYSQGETVDELLINLKEAIGVTLDVMCEDGRSPEQNVQILELAI